MKKKRPTYAAAAKLSKKKGDNPLGMWTAYRMRGETVDSDEAFIDANDPLQGRDPDEPADRETYEDLVARIEELEAGDEDDAPLEAHEFEELETLRARARALDPDPLQGRDPDELHERGR